MRLRARTVLKPLYDLRPILMIVWQASPRLSAVTLLLAVFDGLYPTLNILLISRLVDTVTGLSRTEPSAALVTVLAWPLLLLAILGVGFQFSQHLGQVFSELHGALISNSVQYKVAETMVSVNLKAFEDRTLHNKMRVVADQAPFRPQQLVNDFTRVLAGLTTASSLAAVLIAWHAWIFLLLVGVAVGPLLSSIRTSRAQFHLIKARAETEREKFYMASLAASDTAAKEIRALQLAPMLLNRLNQLLRKLYAQDRSLNVQRFYKSMPLGLLLTAAELVSIVVAANEAAMRVISVGEFTRYLLTTVQVGGQLAALALSFGALQQSALFALDLVQFLSLKPKVEASSLPGRTQSFTQSVPEIRFDNVSFRYFDSGAESLRNVSFTIPAGQLVAIVGANGAGKSTLVKVLAGLYKPSSGTVLFDETDASLLGDVTRMGTVGVVFQDYYIFHLSARENVTVGDVSRIGDSGQVLYDALKKSGFDEVVSRLPQGLDTVLKPFWEYGHELSGGQQQTVALARCFFRQAPVLLLDEPSSALDLRSERELMTRIADDRANRTMIIVTHRLAAVSHVDRILVMKDGVVVADGPHELLLKSSPIYAEMYKDETTIKFASTESELGD